MQAITIIGAGIVGMCTAVALQQRGLSVQVIDEREPGTGTSFGNAGLISVDSCVPIALPGMIKSVPKWLLDPKSPLSVKPSYLPFAASWLLRWVKSGASESKALKQGRALRELHKDAPLKYRELLGSEIFDQSIRITGQLHVWEQVQKSPTDLLGERIRAQNGVTPRELMGPEIFDLIPEMDRSIRRAEFYEKNGHVTNPYLLVQRLFKIFTDNGGQFLRQKVVGISRQPDSNTYRIMTSASDITVRQLVICSGAWSKKVLSGLGVSLPLETERGYHVSFDRSALDFKIPVLHKERAFGVTPMVDNIRVAGFVEIAGLDAAPKMQREEVLINHAKRLFPSLDLSLKKNFWLGFRPSTPDSLPILGRLDAMPNLYFGFGHGHTGITGAPKSAEILANMITGAPNTIDVTPYDIKRF
ncbi:FAD-binding oxidoreductase [Pollutimonas bauzanensis]|jgi:D-amino-acid dehydrogenase|uniref:NAD(P)/FAD-dependent oxidoreductase n=1 Tax=Pollutimonas bauzanensis TaxID=658167 RepID=UPI003342AE2D